jgi:FkbM family methyltransferase
MLRYFLKKLSFFYHLCHLCEEYGLKKSLLIGYNWIKKQSIVVNYYDQEITLNSDRATIFHLLHSFKKIKKLVDSIPCNNCDYILDVGANCGVFSLFAKGRYPESQIYAFEPSPDLQDILIKNLYNRNIFIEPIAVSNFNGECEFFVNSNSQQTNSLIRENIEIFNDAHIRVEKVKCITLDEFISNKNIEEIDVLKIDCQGSEYLILQGAKKTIQKSKYLIIEISFLDTKVFELIDIIRLIFPYYKVINSVLYGADILFSKVPLENP